MNSGLSRDVNRLDRTLSRDLRRFEAQNRADLNDLEALEASMHKQDDTLHDTVGGLDARITKIEKRLGL